MGLYLCIFRDDVELDGVEVGSYADFGQFRDLIVAQLEDGEFGSRFPVLMSHSDCDGEWTPEEAESLREELAVIENEFRQLPPIPLDAGWKQETARLFGIHPQTLYDCFFDVDGEPLLERLASLCSLARQDNLPILFQ